MKAGSEKEKDFKRGKRRIKKKRLQRKKKRKREGLRGNFLGQGSKNCPTKTNVYKGGKKNNEENFKKRDEVRGFGP